MRRAAVSERARRGAGPSPPLLRSRAQRPPPPPAARALNQFPPCRPPLPLTRPRAVSVIVVDSKNYDLRLVAADGSTELFAGTPMTYGHADGAVNVARFGLSMGSPTEEYQGSVYMCDAFSTTGYVRAITVGTRVMRTLLGNAAPDAAAILAGAPNAAVQYGYANGVGTNAQLPNPSALLLDAAGGALFVSDSTAANIRRVDLATGEISAFLGSNPRGPSTNVVTGYQNGPIAAATTMCVLAAAETLARAARRASAARAVAPAGRPPPARAAPIAPLALARRRLNAGGFMCPARGADVQFNADCLAGVVRVISRFVASPTASPTASPSSSGSASVRASPSATASVAASATASPSRAASLTPSPSSACGVFAGNTYGQLPGNFNPGPYDGNNIRVQGACTLDYVLIDPAGTVGTQGSADRITRVCGGQQFVAFGYALAGQGNPGCIHGRTSTLNGGWTCASNNSDQHKR